MNKRIVCIITVLAMCICTCACTASEIENNDKLSIVTTIFPAYDFARELTGDLAQVTMLLSAGGEVHTYEPTPKDMIKIQKCDLFIYNGGESDAWVEDMLSSSEYKDVNVLKMMDCVKVVTEEIKEGMEAQDGKGSKKYSEEEYDEHVWTSPVNAQKICEQIKEKICEADRENQDVYSAKFEVYKAKLGAVDKGLREVAESIDNKMLIFADRFPMRYFADEYGFDYYGAFPGCSSQTEPSSATLVFLINKVKQENIPCVFCIEFSNGKIAETICSQTGAKAYALHSCHNVSSEDFNGGVSYIQLMERNIATLKEAYGV